MKSDWNITPILIILIIVAALAVGISIYFIKDELLTKHPSSTATSTLPSTLQLSTSTTVAVSPAQNAEQQTFKCQLKPEEGYIIVSGKVKFPKGIKHPEQYIVAAIPETYNKISPSGEFCGKAPKGLSMVGAINPDNPSDFSLFYVVISEKDLSDIVIDSQSTAVGMLFAMFSFENPDDPRMLVLIRIIKENPKTTILANKIAEKETLSGTDVKQGPISDAFRSAFESVLSNWGT